ncbi:MAG: formylglycine-generating enzyme family protein [Desulfobulbaceae bacterium]|nr:formylglycine-generating enzyme family protein [Desulfobulbaceae bacterium]
MKKMMLAVMAALCLAASPLAAGELQGVEPAPGEAGGAYTNSLGMLFKPVPAGTFLMGSPGDEAGRDMDESLHRVTISQRFYIQATEVTQGQWQAVMGSNPSRFTLCGPDCPVETVSWDEVQLFINRLNLRTGQNYRLPTEAEFEYAARAGASTAFGNGGITETACDYDPVLDAMGWYCYNAGETTHPVAGKLANGWGLYDMHGNVWEWCADAWDGSDYGAVPATDPVSPTPGENRVIRGGSWENDAWFTRAANRDWCKPFYRNDLVGFRLVLPIIKGGTR